MSFNYDGSGNITCQIQTISSIINYKYPPTCNLSTISGFIFKFYQPTLSGFILPSQHFYTISSSFPQYNFPVSNWNNDQFSNRFVSTFIRGFLSISGNITFQNNGSINNCQNFNGIPTSFNQIVTFNNNTFFNKSISLNNNRFLLRNPTDNHHFLGFSDPSIDGPTLRGYAAVCLAFCNNEKAFIIDINGLTLNTGNIILNSVVLTSPMISYISNVNSDVQQQLNTLSSSIYNIKNNVPFLDSYQNVFTGLNTFTNNSVYFGINQYNSINGESDNFQIKGYKQIELFLSSLNLSIASITNTGITINTGNLQIGTNSLTSSMISYLSNDVQNQFNTLSALIYQKPSGLALLSTANTWGNINNFNSTLQVLGTDILTRISNSVNGLLSSSNTWSNINNFTSTLNLNGTNITTVISNQISSLFLNTLSFNSSSVTYNNSQIGNNQFILYNGFSDSILTLPSCNSIRIGQIVNVSNTQNIQTIANGNFSYPLISSSYNYVSSLPSWTITGYSVIVQQSASPFFPTGNLPSGPNYYQSIAIQTGSNTTSISQNVYLNTGVSTLSFYAGPRTSPNYTVSNYFNVTIGGTIVVSNTTFTVNQNWTLYTVNYSAPNVGNYNLVITSSGGSGDSSISFANITIVTPNNNRILTINATDYQPNLNGFNNGNNLSTSNILLQKNESIMLINDGKNYTATLINFVATSGTTIQTRTFSSRSYTLTNKTISTQAEIFGYDFTPKSSNSSIYVTFDAYASIGGAGSNDSFQARLLIGNLQCRYKDILVPDYQRNRASSLFPISGHRTNTSLTAFRVVIDAARGSGDDVIDITSPAWSCLITEIQN